MAHTDFFLKIDGVDGEAADEKHAGEIVLYGYEIGGSNPGSFGAGGGGGSGKVKLNDFVITKQVDKSSAKLLAAMCTGEHFDKATLTCRRAGKEQQEYLTVVLSPVIVSSFSHAGSNDSESIPKDIVTLNYGKIEFKYKDQKDDGSLGGETIGGWDQVKNKVV